MRPGIWLARGDQAPCWLEPDAAFVSLLDRGLQYGDGLFETVRVLGGEPRHLDRHWQRLQEGAAVLGFGVLPWGLAQVAAATRDAARTGNGYARLTLSRGSGPRGYLPPTPAAPWLALQVLPWEPDAHLQTAGHRLVVSPVPVNEYSPLSRLKSLSALDKVLARQYAQAAGATEALLLNTRGHVVEASSSNLFWWAGEALCTPALETGALSGVMRWQVMEWAIGQGINVHEVHAELPQLLAADEIFLTNVLWGVVPVAQIAGRTFLAPGRLTLELYNCFSY